MKNYWTLGELELELKVVWGGLTERINEAARAMRLPAGINAMASRHIEDWGYTLAHEQPFERLDLRAPSMPPQPAPTEQATRRTMDQRPLISTFLLPRNYPAF